ncbi:MAG: hypothetical protein P1U58_03110 [Verrucomicrobiales bacterium]|nr:hypothetical protein [Verrucomicrobiales bacterium]
MSEEENKVIEDPLTGESEPVSMMSQLGSLMILLVVSGAIWVLFKYLPAAGDWMGKAVDEVIAIDEADEKEEKPSKPESGGKSSGVSSDPPKDSSVSMFSYREQIIEQMGGQDLVEVRHLAISDDKEKMVVALQVTDASGEKQLVEMFFERDEFGRYLSTADSPGETQLKLWAE